MKKIAAFLVAFCAITTITYSQNVGIGTTTPVSKLEVSGADSGVAILRNASLSLDSSKTRLYFRNGLYYTGAIGTHITDGGDGSAAPYARMGFFTFGADAPGLLKERMSILDGGNVGINNLNPTALLDVNGTFRLRGNGVAAGKVLTTDANGLATWQNAGIPLPYSNNYSGTGGTNIFSIANIGTTSSGAALYGSTASTATGSNVLSGATAIVGEVLSTAPGNFSAAIRGINRGTSNPGMGIIGYQAGSGYGVWGETVSGVGVLGTSPSYVGGYFSSVSGTGLYATSSSGTAAYFSNPTGKALLTQGSLQLNNIGEGAGKVLTSDASGNATWQAPSTSGNIGFNAYLSNNTSVPATGPIALTGFTENFDDGGNFNPSTGIYTVSVAGTYLFKCRVAFSSGTATGNVSFLSRITILPSGGGSKIEQLQISQPIVPGYGSSTECTGIVKCGVGDQIHVEAGHSYTSAMSLFGGSAGGSTNFSGARIY